MAANSDTTTIIKKYANRRLYNTDLSAYVTLEDLAEMVKTGEDFVVQDAKSGEDLTRAVLTQIIFEQEGKDGQNLLPISFLRQLISFYGDSMQSMVPSYLEFTMNSFAKEQETLRQQMNKTMETMGVPSMQVPGMDIHSIEDQVRKNTEMFQNAMTMFMPFASQTIQEEAPADEGKSDSTSKASDLDDLKRQISEMQKKLNEIS